VSKEPLRVAPHYKEAGNAANSTLISASWITFVRQALFPRPRKYRIELFAEVRANHDEPSLTPERPLTASIERPSLKRGFV